MLGSEILDVAIGMCFIYLLFSLICSALGELFEAFAKNRAADLERGVKELLSHEDGDKAIEQLYDHPLIYSLYAGKFESGTTKRWYQKGFNLPSYIPAANFALAILDLAVPGSETQVSGAAGSIAAGQLNPAFSVATLRSGVLNSPILNEKTKRGLIALIDSAGGDLVKVRLNLETWYNNAMDRVSGWYKRRTQMIIAGIALTAAAAVNIDSVSLINAISTQKSLRDSLVSASGQYAAKGGAVSESDACQNPKDDPNCKLTSSLGQLKALGVPVGWTNEPFEKNNRGIPGSWAAWLLKIVGWCITAFAACLGAPFWFDTLNKIMIVRSTVKPHEKSREEKSKS